MPWTGSDDDVHGERRWFELEKTATRLREKVGFVKVREEQSFPAICFLPNCGGQPGHLVTGQGPKGVCVASSWSGMATLRAKPAQPEELECDMEDSEGPCDGCSFKLGKSKGGPLSVMEGLLLAGKMHAAIRDNDVPRVRKLLDMGADINKENKEGFSPVWQAARYNLVETLRALIAYGGALIDAPSVTVDQYHWSPVFIAAKRNSTDALRILITAGADVNAPEKREDESPVYVASMHDNAEALRVLIDLGGADINAADKSKQNPVWIAAKHNNSAALRVLLADGERCCACEVGCTRVAGGRAVCDLCAMVNPFRHPFKRYTAADIHRGNLRGETPAWIAAQNECVDALRLLLASGADAWAADEGGRTPIFAAAEQGSVGAVSVLIEAGADTNVPDLQGRTPVFAAASANKIDVLQMLLNAGADVHTPDFFDRAPIWVASALNSVNSLQMLIDASADVNSRGPGLNTPLHAAVQSNALGALSTLIDAGGDALACNKFGKTPLAVAEESSHRSAAVLLRSRLHCTCKEADLVCKCLCGKPPPGEVDDPMAETNSSVGSTASESGLVMVSASQDEHDCMQVLLQVSGLCEIFLVGGNHSDGTPAYDQELLRIRRKTLRCVSVSNAPDERLKRMFAVVFVVGGHVSETQHVCAPDQHSSPASPDHERSVKHASRTAIPSLAGGQSEAESEETVFCFAKDETRRDRWMAVFQRHGIAIRSV